MVQREPYAYMALAVAAFWICCFDILATTITFFLNTGTPPFTDWQYLWSSQLVHYRYHSSVADVLLLAFFRAAPGLAVYPRFSSRATLLRSPKRQKTWWCSFMLFKTSLSCLAILGKASAFKAWDNRMVGACLLIALVCSTVETFLTALILAGVRREPDRTTALQKDDDGYRPLLDEEAGQAVDARGGAASGGEQERKKGGSVGRLLALAKPERGLVFWGTVALFISSLSFMALPYFIGQLIDEVGGRTADSAHEAQRKLDQSTWVLLTVLLVGSVFTFLRGTLFNMAGERLVARIRRDLFERITIQDVGFFDQQKTGELMNRLASDTTVIQNACTSNVSMFLRFGLQVILSTVLLFVTSWQLSLVMFAVVPALILATRMYSAFIRAFSKQYQDALASASDVAQETLSNVRTVRSFAAETLEIGRYQAKVDESYRLGVKKAIAYGFFMGGIGAVSYAAMLLVLWYGGSQVIRGELSPGTLTSFLLYTVYIATGLSVLSGLVSEWMQAVGASERMFELLDRTPDIPLTGGYKADALEGRIRFENVGFRYPSRDDVAVLQNFTLKVEPNATVALVGPSGAGKSTVLSLLQRFYDVSEGAIMIDGRDLRDYDITTLRQHIATVSQEPVLFASTIRENITYGLMAHGKPQPSLEQVMQVAKLANCHDFISRFPEGYDTIVGERGIKLSGGQKQRVAIARALLVDPKILLLDEATSALDAESEHLVQEAIDRLMVGRSTIVIAHRLSTVRNASTIAVVAEGGLRGVGRHEELLQTSDIYRTLIRRQLQPTPADKVEEAKREGEGEKGEKEKAGAKEEQGGTDVPRGATQEGEEKEGTLQVVTEEVEMEKAGERERVVGEKREEGGGGDGKEGEPLEGLAEKAI